MKRKKINKIDGNVIHVDFSDQTIVEKNTSERRFSRFIETQKRKEERKNKLTRAVLAASVLTALGIGLLVGSILLK